MSVMTSAAIMLTATQRTDLVECVLDARTGTLGKLLSSLGCRLTGTDGLRPDLLGSVHTLLEFRARVGLLWLVLSLALDAELTPLPLRNLFVNIAQNFGRAVGPITEMIGGIGEGETHERGEVVEKGAAFVRKVLGNDGDQGTEGVSERTGISLRLFGVDVGGSRRDLGKVYFGEMPKRLLDDVVGWIDIVRKRKTQKAT